MPYPRKNSGASQAQLKKSVDELKTASFTDPLTGAFNRRFFIEYIPVKIAELKRRLESNEKVMMAFIMTDLDHFKRVNDKYGHHSGDEVLKQAFTILKTQCRESDCVVRWGGEEFLVISQLEKEADLLKLLDRLNTSFEHYHFKLADFSTSIKQTCSFGSSILPLPCGERDHFDFESVIDVADFALYNAKSRGRNTWTFIQFNHEIKLCNTNPLN